MNKELKNILLSLYAALGVPFSGILIFAAYIYLGNTDKSLTDVALGLLCLIFGISSIAVYYKMSARKSDRKYSIKENIELILIILLVGFIFNQIFNYIGG